jgi:hypothetical protein
MIKDLPSTYHLTSVPQQERKNVEGTTSNVNGILPRKKKALGRDQTIRSEMEFFTLIGPLLQGSNLSVHHCASDRPSPFSHSIARFLPDQHALFGLLDDNHWSGRMERALSWPDFPSIGPKPKVTRKRYHAIARPSIARSCWTHILLRTARHTLA